MSNTTPFDERAAEYLSGWSQRLSRRGILAGVARVALKVVGVTAVPLLPVDRALAQQGGSVLGCFDWRMCGIHGFFCNACCGGPASYWSCPSCTHADGAWSLCCDKNVCPTYRRIIIYRDCRADAGQAVASLGCTGSECPPGGGLGTDAYCFSGRAFRCTIIEETTVSC